jgi:hypothetical protein
MTRLASTLFATVTIGLTFTGTVLAQSQPDPNTNPNTGTDNDAATDTSNPNPATTTDTTTTTTNNTDVSTPNGSVSAQGSVDLNVPAPPPSRSTDYVVAPTPVVIHETDSDHSFMSGIGIALAAGGGAGGFTNNEMRDTTSVGGDWDVRATFGTRSPLALETSYIGSAQQINALGLDDSAVLVGNGVQGALRLNGTIDLPVQPFVFAGAAWRRYDLTNTNFNTSDVAGSDDVLEIPMGVGIAGHLAGLIVDLRGEFRASTMEDMVPESNGTSNDLEDSVGVDQDSSAAMHRWGAKATIGYEF